MRPDFEPIIIEEVYYNENVARQPKTRARNSVSITPSIMLKNALKIQLKEQKKLFLPTDKVQEESHCSLPNSHRGMETTSELQKKTSEILKEN